MVHLRLTLKPRYLRNIWQREKSGASSCLRFGSRLQVSEDHCALTAQKQVAESPEWVAVMCRERCLSFLSNSTVSLSSFFCSTFERICISNWRPFLGSCLYQEKQVEALSVQVQLIAKLSPSWTVWKEGCCSTSSPLLIPVQKEKSDKISLFAPFFLFLFFLFFFLLQQFQAIWKRPISQSPPQTSNEHLLKHAVPKSSLFTVQLQPQDQEQRSGKCLHCSQLGYAASSKESYIYYQGITSFLQSTMFSQAPASVFCLLCQPKRTFHTVSCISRHSAIWWSDPQLLNQLVKSPILYLWDTWTHKIALGQIN